MGEKIRSFLESILAVIGNERGEVVVADNDELTPEELAALGEDDDSDPDKDADDADDDPDKDKNADDPDKDADPDKDKAGEEENLIPQSAFDKRVAEIRTQAEDKLKLFQTNPEEYYEKYPDEKPTGDESDKELAPSTDIDYAAMQVQGGKYDGMTLNEVFGQDPFEANRMYLDYLNTQNADAAKAESDAKALKEESESQVNEFQSNISKELFGDKEDLTEADQKAVEKVISDTMAYIEDTGFMIRKGNPLTAAYRFMNLEKDRSTVAAETAKGLIEKTTRGKVQTITSDASSGDLTGYESYEAMTADQLADEMDKWSDSKVAKFHKEAPKSLRTKFPNLPWD